MANRFQAKRTAVAGRTANTTNSGNSQYIAAGEFALNMADQILYTSDGTNLITIGANQVNQSVTGNLTIQAIIANGSLGTSGQVLTTNSTGVYWSTVSGGSGSINVDSQYTWTNIHTFSNTVYLTAISANGSLGTTGQVLTSNGSSTYWSTASGSGGSFDYGLAYAFRTQPF